MKKTVDGSGVRPVCVGYIACSWNDVVAPGFVRIVEKHCAGIEKDVLLSGNNISVNHTAIEYPGVCV